MQLRMHSTYLSMFSDLYDVEQAPSMDMTTLMQISADLSGIVHPAGGPSLPSYDIEYTFVQLLSRRCSPLLLAIDQSINSTHSLFGT